MSVSAPAEASRWLVPTVLGIAVFAADQFSKAWVTATLGPQPGAVVRPIVGDWFNLVYGRNTGVAFGLLPDIPAVFTVTSIVITLGAIYAYAFQLPNRNPWVQTGMGLVLGGAIGNIADRLRLGFVVDFIQVGWWPLFNLADSAITLGVTILAGYLIFIGDDPAPVARPMPRDDGLLSELLSKDLE